MINPAEPNHQSALPRHKAPFSVSASPPRCPAKTPHVTTIDGLLATVGLIQNLLSLLGLIGDAGTDASAMRTRQFLYISPLPPGEPDMSPAGPTRSKVKRALSTEMSAMSEAPSAGAAVIFQRPSALV